MIEVVHKGMVFPGGYRSDFVLEPWPPGEVRAVPAPLAAYLVETFPEAFVVLGEVPAGPPDALLDSAPSTPAGFGDLVQALELRVADLLPAIRGGVYDDHLVDLATIESAGGERKTVLEALYARWEQLGRPGAAPAGG